MTHWRDHTDAEKRSIIETLGTSPQRRFYLEQALYPVTSAAEWLAVYEKWKDAGVNLEGLLLEGQVHDWIPPGIAKSLL